MIEAEMLLFKATLEDTNYQIFILLLQITLVRSLAKVVAYDHVVVPIGNKHCKRQPLLDLSKGNESLKEQQQDNCITIEHYVPTLLAVCKILNLDAMSFSDEMLNENFTHAK
ncbi:unnamed protein product [Lactuca saligna]|uniref:Uncharacterized protein n=1 Tax=Lactuca saligna TaxID=75948 RepID=A0AA35Y644_LACSI|nr:unnamed protein product [Lactuca saligna]